MAGEKGKRRKRRPKGAPDKPVHSERFIDAAKALWVDESREAFEKAFRLLEKEKGKP